MSTLKEIVPPEDSPLRFVRGLAHVFVPPTFPFRKDAKYNPALAYLFLRHPPRISEISSVAGWCALLYMQYMTLTTMPFTFFGYRYFIYAFTAYFAFTVMVLAFDLAKDYTGRVLRAYPLSELRLTLLTPRDFVQALTVPPLGLAVFMFTIALVGQSILVMSTFYRRIGMVPADIVLQSVFGALLIWVLGVALAQYSVLATVRIHLLFKSKFVAQAKTLKSLPLGMSFLLATVPLLILANISYVKDLRLGGPFFVLALYAFLRLIYNLVERSNALSETIINEFEDWWAAREGEPKLDEELESMVPTGMRKLFLADESKS